MKKLISSILVFAVIVVSIITIPITSANATETANGEYEIRYDASDRVIVSLGDSYSAGEGLGDYIGGTLEMSERVESEDWLSHRSYKSWPGQLTLNDSNGNTILMNENRDFYGRVKLQTYHIEGHWFFAAMSGAVTHDITGEANKDYYKIDYDTLLIFDNRKQIPPQIKIFDQLGNKKADYVTMTMGGNDVEFVGVVTQAAINVPYLEYASMNPLLMEYQPISKAVLASKLNDMQENVMPDTLKRLEENYKLIAKKAGSQAHIIIAGYPKLISPDSNNPVFTKTDAKMIADKVEYFNDRIKETVKKCETNGINISFVSVDGADQFGNHGAYSPNGEYICGLSWPTSQDINDFKPGGASFHPNEFGAEVYRKCVQDEIDRIESQKTRVWGKVVDENNKAKEGVRVILTDENNEIYKTNTSDSNGNYGIELDYKEGRHYSLKFESVDYEPLVVKEDEGGNRITVNAKLTKRTHLVTDAMRGTYKVYDSTSQEFAIPKINLDSTDAKNVNKKILDNYKDCFKDNNTRGIAHLNYSFGADEKTLSVLIAGQLENNYFKFYESYNFDISSGGLISNDELLSRYNYSESNAVTSVQNDIIRRYSEPIGVMDEGAIQRSRQKALSQNQDISNMRFYMDENNNVNIIYYAAWPVGSEAYYYTTPLTKDDPIEILLSEEMEKYGLSTLVGMWDSTNARSNRLHDCIDFYKNPYSLLAAPYNGTYNGYQSNSGSDYFFNYSYNIRTGDLTVTNYKYYPSTSVYNFTLKRISVAEMERKTNRDGYYAFNGEKLYFQSYEYTKVSADTVDNDHPHLKNLFRKGGWADMYKVKLFGEQKLATVDDITYSRMFE